MPPEANTKTFPGKIHIDSYNILHGAIPVLEVIFFTFAEFKNTK